MVKEMEGCFPDETTTVKSKFLLSSVSIVQGQSLTKQSGMGDWHLSKADL